MEIDMKFLTLSADQVARFQLLKTSREAAFHGPLAFGQEVPVHTHELTAVYLVQGLAEFVGTNIRRVLGIDATANAVLVPAGEKHGWIGLRANTLIEHVIGTDVEAIMA